MKNSLDEIIKAHFFGMLKLKLQFDLDENANMLDVSQKELENLLFEMVGEGKLNGELQQNKFVISSDVNQIINWLQHSVHDMENKQKTREEDKFAMESSETLKVEEEDLNQNPVDQGEVSLLSYQNVVLVKSDFDCLKAFEKKLEQAVPAVDQMPPSNLRIHGASKSCCWVKLL